MLLKKADSEKKSFWVMGSYLWSWHCAHWTVSPMNAVPTAVTRSRTFLKRLSSGRAVPLSMMRWRRLKPEAASWSLVGFGMRSPASW